jgi:hypothetical protein
MADSPTNPESIWTIIAAIGAGLSAIYAFNSNRIAKKALEIANQDHLEKKSSFDLYLIDSYSWSDKKRDRRILLFNITLKNKSASKSSFKASLEIEYIKSDDNVARIILDHNPTLVSEIPQKTLSVFPIDIRIEEKGFDSKWLIFEQPTNVFNNFRIEKYSVQLQDTQANIKIVNVVLMKEIDYEN